MKSTLKTLSLLLIGVTVAAVMSMAADVLVPLALAGLLSFALAGPTRAIERVGLPRPIAVAAVVALAFAAIFALGQMLASEVGKLSDDLPRYETAIQDKIEGLYGEADSSAASSDRPRGVLRGPLERAQRVLRDFGREISAESRKADDTGSDPGPFPADRHLSADLGHGLFGAPLQAFIGVIGPVLDPLVSVSLAFVFVVFILIQREDLRDRLVRLAGAEDIPHTTAALDEAGRRLSRLFFTESVINSVYGLAVFLGLWWIGVPGAVVWGMLSGALRFVPFVGPVLSAIFPVALSVAVGPGWSAVLWTAALYGGLEAVIGQVVEPRFFGRATGMSPVAYVVAATFWGYTWGSIGLVLSTPLTMILVVLGRHFEALKVFDILLGDTPALTDAEALYQHLLSRNAPGAIGAIRRYVSGSSLSAYCDEVVRPALSLARRDMERGRLRDEELTAFVATYEKLFAELARSRWLGRRTASFARSRRTDSLPLAGANHRDATFVAIGARDALDDAASFAIATIVESHGVETRTLPAHVLTAQDGADISGAALVCLSITGPRTDAEVVETAGRLRAAAPNAKLMIGAWCAPDDASVERLGKAANANCAFRSFAEAATAALDEANEGGRRSAPVAVEA
jgi:predicted PurR-regulated permease PerM